MRGRESAFSRGSPVLDGEREARESYPRRPPGASGASAGGFFGGADALGRWRVGGEVAQVFRGRPAPVLAGIGRGSVARNGAFAGRMPRRGLLEARERFAEEPRRASRAAQEPEGEAVRLALEVARVAGMPEDGGERRRDLAHGARVA